MIGDIAGSKYEFNNTFDYDQLGSAKLLTAVSSFAD